MSSSGHVRRVVSHPLVRCAAAIGIAALLAACGGGDPLEEFRARRVLALGDETSVITSAGSKYTVNALQADNVTLDCAANPIWVQIVASSFGLVFPQCNPNNVAAPASRILAAPGAKVADVTRQIDAHLASDSFGSKDLVTMLVGRHDVLDIYRRFPTISRAQAELEARAAGAALAVQVNRVAAAGGKVLLGKVLDLGQTPFGLAEKAANSGHRPRCAADRTGLANSTPGCGSTSSTTAARSAWCRPTSGSRPWSRSRAISTSPMSPGRPARRAWLRQTAPPRRW